MDAALFRAPDIIESTGKLRGTGMAVLRAGSATVAQQQQLSEAITIAEFQFRNMQDGLAKAFSGNATLAKAVDAKPTLDDTAAVFDLVRKTLISSQDYSPENQARYLAAANKASESQNALTARLLQALEVIIGNRIADLKWDLYKVAIVTTLSTLLAGYFFFTFFLVTRGGMRQISRHLVEMSQGDLRYPPSKPLGTDEPAAVIEDLRVSYTALHELIRKVRHGARALHASSAEISAASLDLSARTEASAASLEQQAAAMEEIGATVRDTATSAKTAASFAVDNAHVAEAGGKVFVEVVTTMQEIHASSSKIGDIIGVIDGIAFQTNILALNAAVEAARAGDAGRGFAVVASEVRSLAGRSAEAAREIKSLISASVAKVESGARVVEQAGVSMQQVVTNARQINDFLSAIANSANEQAVGVEEVGRAIQELDRNTQQNAALVEETSASSAALSDQADTLQDEIANFRVA
jgi:methyl-accepting chemotaxis protein